MRDNFRKVQRVWQLSDHVKPCRFLYGVWIFFCFIQFILFDEKLLKGVDQGNGVTILKISSLYYNKLGGRGMWVGVELVGSVKGHLHCSSPVRNCSVLGKSGTIRSFKNCLD